MFTHTTTVLPRVTRETGGRGGGMARVPLLPLCLPSSFVVVVVHRTLISIASILLLLHSHTLGSSSLCLSCTVILAWRRIIGNL